MKLTVNGETMEFRDEPSVKELLGKLGLVAGGGPSRVAVAVNLEVIPRDRHAKYALHEGDRVEIIQAVGGG